MIAPDRETEIRVGLFVGIGLGLMLLSILLIGGDTSLFTRKAKYRTHFPAVDGLMVGSKVMLSGIQIGSVTAIEMDGGRNDVEVMIEVAEKHKNWIKQDTEAEVTTQGVLGDKYITLYHGSPNTPPLAEKGEIASRTSQGIAGFLSKSDALLVNLNNISKNLDRMISTFNDGNRATQFFDGLAKSSKNIELATSRLSGEIEGMKLRSTVNHLNSILEKIDNGTGSVGALVNDSGLYDDAKALIGRANRNRVIRNLVRKTIQENTEE